MADLRLHLGYGNFEAKVAAQRRADAFSSSLCCPHCFANKQQVLNIPRTWWQKLLYRQHKHFVCLECEKTFLVRDDSL